jgi:hypothetical protein
VPSSILQFLNFQHRIFIADAGVTTCRHVSCDESKKRVKGPLPGSQREELGGGGEGLPGEVLEDEEPSSELVLPPISRT